MRFLFAALAFFLTVSSTAQKDLPFFLQGTWKMEGKENYEHWDSLNADSMKGFSYSLKDGKMVVSEYLDICRNGHEIHYTATVLNQNQGKPVRFFLTGSDTAFVFENQKHVFPKKIMYRSLTDKLTWVQVSDGMKKGLSWNMERISP